MIKPKWNSEAVKAYETGQGVELVNDPYPHYIPKPSEPTENKTHKCITCSCDYTDDEGGVQGYFGMLMMSFCPTCLSSVLDMAEQLNPKEWIELMRGVRVDGDTVVITVKGGNDVARELCGAFISMAFWLLRYSSK